MSLEDLIPTGQPPITRHLTAAAGDRLEALATEVDARDYNDPDQCPLSLLVYLAWGLGMNAWDDQLPEAAQRQRVREWPTVAKKMGTPNAIRQGLAAFGMPLTLTEWHQAQPRGPVGTFCINLKVGETPVTAQTQRTMHSTIRQTKRASILLACLTFESEVAATVHIGGCVKTGHVVVLPEVSGAS